MTRPVVFVVDDDPAARESVVALAESMGHLAKGYSSAEEFLKEYRPGQAGCLVADVRLLGMSGLDLQVRLRELEITLPVIVITAYADVPLAVRGMQEGAISVLEKPCRDQELWSTIRKALEHDLQTREKEAARIDTANRIAMLSPEERAVMHKIALGIPNKTIATEMGLSLRTVETRRHNVFRKLNVETLAELIRLVIGSEDQPQSD